MRRSSLAIIDPEAVTAGYYAVEVADLGDGTLGLVLTPVDDALGGDVVHQGDRFRQGSRDLDPYEGVLLQSHQDTPGSMVIYRLTTDGDSEDVNIDGAIIVRHGKDYTGTPGYAGTMQLYTEAGLAGTIVGNNDYVGDKTEPYDPPTADVDTHPNGFLRFELGPIWPLSEKARLNNYGDFTLGWDDVASGTASQTASTTVTATTGIFTSDMVGDFVVWRDGGRAARITGYTSGTSVTVEQSDTHGSTAIYVRRPRLLFRHDGPIEAIDGLELRRRAGQTGPLLTLSSADGATTLELDETTDLGGGGSGSTHWEVVTIGSPPEEVLNPAGDDWLYVEVPN